MEIETVRQTLLVPFRRIALSALVLSAGVITCPASLISYYNFDDGATVTDQVGTNDGTVISDASFAADTPDGSPGALDLNGFSPQDYVRLGEAWPSGPDFEIGATNSFTISMWVRFEFSQRGIVTIKQDLTGGGGDRSGITFGINETDSPFLGLIHSSGGDDSANALGTTFHDVTTDQAVPFDQWTHMVATYDGATDALVMYVDGVAATTYTDGNGTSSMNPDGTNLTGGVGIIDLVDSNGSFTGFGASGNGPEDPSSAGDFTRLFYDGLLDDVAIWNNALSSNEIALLFSGTKPPELLADSDGDGMSDAYENGFDFLDPDDSSDADSDEDDDGLSNLEESQRGTAPDDEDSDDDGLNDGEEINTHGTNPLVADGDLDGLSDGEEINLHGTLPDNADTDGDTISDGEEVIPGTDGFETDPLARDTDGDTFDDNVEIAAGTDPTESTDFPEVVTGGLVSYYSFDDGETVTDQVGGNHGSVISSAEFSDLTPNGSGMSLDLGGNAPQDYVRIGPPSPDGPDFEIGSTNSLTISMWVNYTFSERGIVTIRQDLTSGGGDRSGLTFGLNGSGNPFVGLIHSSLADDSANGLGSTWHDVITDQVVPLSTWTHLAMTYESLTDTLRVYVDGVAATSYTDGNGGGSINPDGGNLTGGVGMIDFVDADGSFTGFGASGNGPEDASSAGDFTRLFYDGLLDEVGIWNTALPDEDIAELATGVAPPDLGGGGAPFQLTKIDFDFSNSSVVLTWNSRSGKTYGLESSTDLDNWSLIDDDIPSQGTSTSYTDRTVPDPEVVKGLFYQIREMP